MNRTTTITTDFHPSILDVGDGPARGACNTSRLFSFAVGSVQLSIAQRSFPFLFSTLVSKGDFMNDRNLAIKIERVLDRLIEARRALEVEHDAKLEALGRPTNGKETS